MKINRLLTRCAVAAQGLIIVLSACSPAPIEDHSEPTWGPMSQGECVNNQPKRRYNATLFGGGADACDGPFQNVMGAHFTQPTDCSGDVGYWHAYDSSCAATMPVLPGPSVERGPATPAEGFADLHNHLLAHIAFGESVLWGASFGEPRDVLTPIPGHLEKAHQRVEAFSSSRSLAGLFGSHDEDGFPTYQTWPTQALKTHQQSHVDWLYRAYQGGLRLVVVHAVNNQDMFGRGENRLPGVLKFILEQFGSDALPAPHRTSNDMEALEHQVRAAHELVAWVKEHRGGWLAIAQTPEQASQLIAEGKMALVLGSEVDHQFNCDLGRRCSSAHIEEGLTKLEAMGLAVLFPTHHKETQFGGAANFQPLNTGPLRPCSAFLGECSAIGLSDKGVFLIKEMMSRGLLADLGHAGDKPFADTLALLKPFQYPTLMTHASAHPMRPNGAEEYTFTYAQLQRIKKLGGMVSVHSAGGEYAGIDNAGAGLPFASTDGGGGFAQGYLYARDALGDGYFDKDDLALGGQLAFAPDWNGFAGWPFGRFGVHAKSRRTHEATGQPLVQPPPLVYPIALPPNLVPAAVGARTSLEVMALEGVRFDFNERGLAQAGLMPDLLADMRLHGLSDADLDPLYRSARGFVEMWRRAREIVTDQDRGWLRWLPPSPTDLIEFDYLDQSRLVEFADGAGICRHRGSKALGFVAQGVCVGLGDQEQQLESDAVISGEIRNANSGLCLDRADAPKLQQSVCNNAASQLWEFVPVALASERGELRASTTNTCVIEGGGELVMSDCAEDSSLLLQRIGNTYRIRTAENDCAQIQDRRLDAGAPGVVTTCPAPGRADFHWEFDALRDAREYERLFSTKALSDAVIWASAAGDRFVHPITTAEGIPLCRAANSLGLLQNAGCQIAPARRVPDYEQLWSSAPLVH